MDHDKVVLPRSLTAENGAKALLIGEFHELIMISCETCAINGYASDCIECDGEGESKFEMLISWTTIKNIYRKIVENLGENDE